MITDTYAHAATCPYCARLNNCASNFGRAERHPQDGDAIMCMGCGQWSVVQHKAKGGLRKPTIPERRQLADDEVVQRITRSWRTMSVQTLDEYVEERRKGLSTLNMEWARQVLPAAIDDETRLIAMHKARYDCPDITAELRHESGRWLRERGYGALGGRPLLDEGLLP
jgi:hypothetical protein